jgi:hypothetical protein
MKFKLAFAAAALAASGLAQSATIDWNTWTSNSTGTIDSTSVTTTFTGQTNLGWYASYPSWAPGGTYADGTVVANGPSSTNGIVVLNGGNTNVQTITFSTPVVDPVMAIWSLGQGGIDASFDFTNATPVFVAGGVSVEYGGSSIVVSGSDVSGSEGNGTVQFIGTYSSISWTNPTFENWYGFDVGVAGVSAVPEPGSMGLLLAGLTLVGLAARRRQKR